jgi:cyanophycinase
MIRRPSPYATQSLHLDERARNIRQAMCRVFLPGRIMTRERKPIFLLADSQLLFCNTTDNTVLQSLQESLRVTERNITRAAYIGASNGDDPEFFGLFAAAMDQINLHESRLIRSGFGSEDRVFLENADVVLLAGGDTEAGWKIITSTGMDAVIRNRYYEGAVLVGVSAGAMQLGMGWHDNGAEGMGSGLKLVPYYVDVHDERDDWAHLRTLVQSREEYAKGFGIPSGGAMIYHADMSVEAVRFPVAEFERTVKEKNDRQVTANLLLPVNKACA